MALLPTDYYEIQNLLHRYCLSLDFSQPDAYVSCFAEDGSFESIDLVPQHKGTQRLRELAGKLMANNGDTEVRHLTINSIIEGEGDTASALSYCIATRNRSESALGKPCADLVNTGVYQDKLVKVHDGWKIAARVHNNFPKGTQYLL
jgi:hypothetical protein